MNRQLFSDAYALFQRIEGSSNDADIITDLYEALEEARGDGYEDCLSVKDVTYILNDIEPTQTPFAQQMSLFTSEDFREGRGEAPVVKDDPYEDWGWVFDDDIQATPVEPEVAQAAAALDGAIALPGPLYSAVEAFLIRLGFAARDARELSTEFVRGWQARIA